MKKILLFIFFSFSLLSFSAADQGKPRTRKAQKKSKRAKIQYGTASFYANNFNGKKTANGEIFNQGKLTAAHNNVPLGTWLRVTNLRNKKSVIVRVTDRLHHRNMRLVDLSRAAARHINFAQAGLLPVRIEVMGPSRPVATL